MEHGSGLDRLLMQCVIRRQASIFERKTLSARLRDRKRRRLLQARREGPAFFDEDDAGAVY